MTKYNNWREAASLILVARSIENTSALSKGCRPGPTLEERDAELKLASTCRPKHYPSSSTKVAAGFQLPKNVTYTDYKMLFLKRHKGNRSFASADVFPGGMVDPADFSPKWQQVFRKVGIDLQRNFPWKNIDTSMRPPLLARSRDPESLPNDIALRICAIRETFEESGVLLLSKPEKIIESLNRAKSPETAYCRAECSSTTLGENELQVWRKKIHKEASQFITMCEKLKLVPNVWSLFEWSHFLTPAEIKRRFDTIFYLAVLDDIPNAVIDEEEVVNLQWRSPAEALDLKCKSEVILYPPQIYECFRLLHFPSISDVEEYGIRRISMGALCTIPVLFKMKNYLIETFPGDDMYPLPVDFGNKSKIEEVEETEEENLRRCKNLHRLVWSPPHTGSLYCNVELPLGLIGPTTYIHMDDDDSISKTILSKI